MAGFFQASYFISEVIALSGVGLNAFQILSTIRGGRRRTPFDLSILSLSIADFLSSNFTFFFMVYWHLVHNSIVHLVHSIDIIGMVCMQYGIISSMFHLVFIAVQRVFAVTLPIEFRFRFTPRFCHISITFISILSLASSVLNVFVATYDIIGYVVLASEVLLVVTYSIICGVVKKRDSAMKLISAYSLEKRKIFRHTFSYSMYVSFAFILCTLPATLYSVKWIKRVDPSYVFEWVRWMFYLNPTIDSIIYFHFKKKRAKINLFRFKLTSQLNCEIYNLVSAQRTIASELTKKLSGQRFSYSKCEVNQETSRV